MRLEDVDDLAKMAATYKRLAKMEADLRRDWNCQRITIKIEWQATGKADEHVEGEMHNVLRIGFSEAVKNAREMVQAKLALLGVEQFPEVK